MGDENYSLSKIEDLEWQNAKLKTMLWDRDPDRLRRSEWFFLIDSKHRPSSGYPGRDVSERYFDEILQDFAVAVREGNIITLNKKTHNWGPDYIERVQVRYVVEFGLGRMKKDGTRGKSGGTVHCHVQLIVFHRSNIKLEHEKLVEFFDPIMLQYFAKKPFIGPAKFVPGNRTEEYMEKGFEKAHWKKITVIDRPPL